MRERLKHYFKAIDADDTALFWEDRKKWYRKHSIVHLGDDIPMSERMERRKITIRYYQGVIDEETKRFYRSENRIPR